MSSNHLVDPKNQPLVYRPKAGPHADINHQLNEFASGDRGGGSVPSTFTWANNPKQNQEERGSGNSELNERE